MAKINRANKLVTKKQKVKEAIYSEDTNKITQDNILIKKRNNNSKEKVNMTKKSKISLTKLMKE